MMAGPSLAVLMGGEPGMLRIGEGEPIPLLHQLGQVVKEIRNTGAVIRAPNLISTRFQEV